MWCGTFYRIRLARLVCALLALLSLTAPAFAAVLDIQTSTGATGGVVGPLNTVGDDFCPSATTPGCDVSATNNRVRTNDAVSYHFAVQADPPGDDIYIRTQLKAGAIWEDLPGICDPFNSTITGAGTAISPSELHCDLGFRSSWAANLTFTAKVLGTIPNGANIGILSAEIGGDNSPTITATPPTDILVTASPRLDLRKRIHTIYPGAVDGVSGVTVAYQIWIGLWDHDRNGNAFDDPEPLLGNEMIDQVLSFTEDMSQVSPNAYLRACYVSNSGSFPFQTYNSATPERSVVDAGVVSCANTGATATGTQTVTVTGADLSFSHIPTQRRTGNVLLAEYSTASFGFVTIFVPASDISAAGGTLATLNTFSNFNPTSISGQANFNGVGEDISNNTYSYSVQSNAGSYSQSMRCRVAGDTIPPWCVGPWYNAPTNASIVSGGDGNVEPEQSFVSYTYYRNNSFIGDAYVDVCSVFDARYVKPVTYGSTSDASRCHGHCGTRNTDYVIEYGTGYADPSTAWRTQ